VKWGAERGIRIRPVGIELNPIAAGLASARGVPTAVACAGAPPFADKSVDVVLVSQVAHHLTSKSVVDLLRTCNGVARRAVIIADLRRNRFARPAFWCGAHVLGFDDVTIADGMTSIRRGFSRRELMELLVRAGIDGQVHRRPGFRLVATWSPVPS
jgi:hypothetical protein